MWLAVFLILFFALILYLLLIPIVLCINTAQNEYYVQLQGIAKASIEEHEDEVLRIRLRVLLMNFYFYPLRKIGTLSWKKEDKKKLKTKKSKSTSKRGFNIRKIVPLLKSFTVKRLWMDIDTGDNVLNAKLYPYLGFMNYYVGSFNINFEGKNELELQLQNRPINIIKSYINY